MNSVRQIPTPLNSFASFTVAVVSLCLTGLVTFRQSKVPSTIDTKTRIFDFHGRSLIDITPVRFWQFPKTNRTIWEAVSTSELHAGLQRVEPDAWIPTHAHDTEEIIVVISGQGTLYDENGIGRQISSGNMVHFESGSKHTVHNSAMDEPLFLMWTFPRKFGRAKFKFQETYQR